MRLEGKREGKGGGGQRFKVRTLGTEERAGGFNLVVEGVHLVENGFGRQFSCFGVLVAVEKEQEARHDYLDYLD